ncbi:MAG: hypothetical protein NTY53_21105, partial [Kiritimatiellaeota bacterium]|nr:hypothetical protein [Kiritimatiellota bacterium]
CGFPDEYDYGSDSIGGVGKFCLMGQGNNNGSPVGANPAQVGAYLKRAAGWATTIELDNTSTLLATVSSAGADFNKFYRYQKPGVDTEYFLVENRQKSGHDANLPAAGIAIWHIDELGDKSNSSTNYNASHLNYEISLMQADNLWHFQANANSGDSKDLYYTGNTAAAYTGQFNDNSAPCARWWDGSLSGVDFRSSATASNLWRFMSWNDGVSNATRTVTVPDVGATYTATFVQTAAVISVSVKTNVRCGVTGGGTFLVGTSVWVTATASNNWRFVNWQDGLTNNPRQVVVVSNLTYTATFASTLATLSVQAAPVTGGRVSGGGTYAIGSNVLISASASNAWLFIGWNDGFTNTPRWVTVPDGGAAYTAFFQQTASLNVYASTNAGGTVTGGGTFLVGDSVWITATVSNGWRFIRWSDGTTNNPQLIVVSAGGASYTALFAPTAVLTMQANPANGGSVTGGGTYVVGSNAVLTATPSNLWRFIRWSDSVTNNPRTVVVPSKGDIYTANFGSLGTVTVQANPTNSGSVAGGGQFLVGSSVTVTATPGINGAFLNWNGSVTNNPWTFSVPAGSTVCTANFTRLGAVVGVASPVRGGSVLGGGTYPIGTNIQAAGDIDGDGVTTNPRLITTPPQSMATYTAIFTLPSVSLALGRALNATGLPWQTGDDANWFVTSALSRDGLAVQSGPVSGGQTTWLQAITNGPGTLVFWWKISSENSDTLQFTVNGQLMAQLAS